MRTLNEGLDNTNEATSNLINSGFCQLERHETLKKKQPLHTKECIAFLSENEQSDNGFPCVAYEDNTFLVPEEEVVNMTAWMSLSSDLKTVAGISSWKYVYAPLYTVRKEYERAVQLSSSLTKVQNNRHIDVHKKGAIRKLHSIVNDFHKVGASDIHIRLEGSDALCFGRVHGLIDTTPARRKRNDVMEMIAAAINHDGDDHANDNFNPNRPGSTKLDDMLVTDQEGNQSVISVRVQYRSLVAGDDARKACVLRLLGTGKVRTIEELGLPEKTQAVFKSAMHSGQGMILITGVTGAGKSTTLHACINAKPPQAIVHTIEDPVEIESNDPLVFQGNASLEDDEIRELVRLDPDIGVSGEIRDEKSAVEAFGMARTGHLMLATFHANDGIAAISRLARMGLSLEELAEDGLLKMLVAQRLVPTLCSCAKKVKAPEEVTSRNFAYALWQNWELTATQEALNRLKVLASKDKLKVRKEDGCKKCNHRGVNGRKLVLEYIMVDDSVRQYIRNNDLDGLRKNLIDRGWKPMSEQGWELIESGQADPNLVETIIENVVVDKRKQWEY